jgi:acetyl-CoA carboxylase carboxyl transferase alpha subunit
MFERKGNSNVSSGKLVGSAENKEKKLPGMQESDGKVWNNILNIRSMERLKGKDILHHIFTDFFELHGDRYYGDDKAIIGGLAYLNYLPVTVICQYKGSDLMDAKTRNYGMPLPEGYRKALRLMKQAEKFNRPIICFIDTPGAYPGVNAEERGQAEAIAKNLYEMASLKIPIISIVISEGGSGGALALGVANKIYMLEKAIYSVISPEGCASILWRDPQQADLASDHLKLTSKDIFSTGVIDGIISEDGDFDSLCNRLKDTICNDLTELLQISGEKIKDNRRNKFKDIGNKMIVYDAE